MGVDNINSATIIDRREAEAPPKVRVHPRKPKPAARRKALRKRAVRVELHRRRIQAVLAPLDAAAERAMDRLHAWEMVLAERRQMKAARAPVEMTLAVLHLREWIGDREAPLFGLDD